MEWRDEGTILAVRPHGETAAIAEVLTRDHGRHLGIVHGGRSRTRTPILQPGNAVAVTWRARLDVHMGSLAVEPLRLRAGSVLSDPLRLDALSSVCAVASFVLPEREPVAAFHERTESLCDAIVAGEGWLHDYAFWELALLEVSGLRLDLSACAVTGAEAPDLSYVSPRTGRAVSRRGAGDWADRLLPLPRMLVGGPTTLADVIAALDLTGHFLEHRLAPSLGDRPLPAARGRFVEAVRRERD
ncbi:DNA repair protein RecO [Jannaschia sp. LMIT008]|uniref:DNA repair protein RecO n=1 Tax=Jannaschia maritima TaxID=3032585 RepID=UPI0028112EC5|nr:DNA repair protein RecO [Jannaschia sp. LMIT008]